MPHNLYNKNTVLIRRRGNVIQTSHLRVCGKRPSASKSEARFSDDDVCLRCFAILFFLNFVDPSMSPDPVALPGNPAITNDHLSGRRHVTDYDKLVMSVLSPFAGNRFHSMRMIILLAKYTLLSQIFGSAVAYNVNCIVQISIKLIER